MENPFYVSLSRQTALRRQMDTVANNLANMNTTGFKSEQMTFAQHIENLAVEGGKGYFVSDRATFTNFNEGALQTTGNPLDVALQGDAYFVVRTATGDAYTRDGRLKIGPDGVLMTSQGLPVLSNIGDEIVVPDDAGQISITSDGTISIRNGEVIGRLRVVTLPIKEYVTRHGDGLFRTDLPVVDSPTAKIVQGMLESSNVNPISELTAMINVQRSYESTSRAIENENDKTRRMIETLGRPG
jgi:flagellar basal-body rod protein FlgF